MTQVPVPIGQGNLPANMGDYQFVNTGLEDFKVSDAVLPRIKIDHPGGQWVDNLGGIRMDVLRFVALGLVKQRVLFHHQVGNDDVPMCKSTDFNLGYPNQNAPQDKSFPWDLAGFDPNDFPADAEGYRKLPCDGCQLKEWGSNPVSDNPYCSEQWTLPIYYETSGLPDGIDWSPAILTLQKSSIKPIRTYFTSFAQSNKPPFLAIGRGTLKVETRGSVKYSVPSFSKEGESDRSRWMEFSEQFGEMKAFLMRPPVSEGNDAGAEQSVPSDNTYTGPPQQPVQQVQQVQQPVVQQPVVQQPVQQVQQPVVQQPVVQQPVQQVQQPVQQVQQPVVQQPVVQQPVVQQPVQQVQQPVVQQPVQQPVVQQPVVQQPVQQDPWTGEPAQQAPVEQAPVEQAPVEQAPVEQAPVQPTPPPAGQGLPF